jgi:hypothetical protein
MDNTAKLELMWQAIEQRLRSVSQRTLEWISIVMIHCACVPSTVAFIRGVSDLMPSTEVVLFMWTGLLVYFIKSFVENNRLMMFTNAIAFFVQAMLLALVVYK